MEDKEIVALYHARSEDAIMQTAAKYGRYCHAIAFRILQSDADAEECVSDTYLRAWNAIPPHCPQSLQTFLGRITRNLSLSLLEKRSADKRGGGQLPLVLEELAECLPDRAQEAQSETACIREALERFLSGLSKETRVIFVRRYWHMQSAAEIALALGTTPNRVNVTLHRTRKKLQTYLKQEGITV